MAHYAEKGIPPWEIAERPLSDKLFLAAAMQYNLEHGGDRLL